MCEKFEEKSLNFFGIKFLLAWISAELWVNITQNSSENTE
jgi:hypothetical protein